MEDIEMIARLMSIFVERVFHSEKGFLNGEEFVVSEANYEEHRQEFLDFLEDIDILETEIDAAVYYINPIHYQIVETNQTYEFIIGEICRVRDDKFPVLNTLSILWVEEVKGQSNLDQLEEEEEEEIAFDRSLKPTLFFKLKEGIGRYLKLLLFLFPFAIAFYLYKSTRESRTEPRIPSDVLERILNEGRLQDTIWLNQK